MNGEAVPVRLITTEKYEHYETELGYVWGDGDEIERRLAEFKAERGYVSWEPPDFYDWLIARGYTPVEVHTVVVLEV